MRRLGVLDHTGFGGILKNPNLLTQLWMYPRSGFSGAGLASLTTVTAVCVLQVTGRGHLGLGDSSGAIARVLVLQALALRPVPNFALTD